ncbi:MAG: hypothetical protein ABIE43_05650 [Patescibacteria group bacterium]
MNSKIIIVILIIIIIVMGVFLFLNYLNNPARVKVKCQSQFPNYMSSLRQSLGYNACMSEGGAKTDVEFKEE